MIRTYVECGVEQWLARQPHKLKVVGSSPTPATNHHTPEIHNANTTIAQKAISKTKLQPRRSMCRVDRGIGEALQ